MNSSFVETYATNVFLPKKNCHWEWSGAGKGFNENYLFYTRLIISGHKMEFLDICTDYYFAVV